MGVALMSGLEETTGVRSHDGDKAEHSVRDLMSGIMAAIAAIRGHEVIVDAAHVTPKPKCKVKIKQYLSLPAGPERLGLTAGPIQGEPGKAPDALEPSPPPLAVLGEIEIRVGDSFLRTSRETLAQDMKEHDENNPGFIDSFESALSGDDLKPDSPPVSIFQDGRLEFYRDSEKTFLSSSLQQTESGHVIDADIVEKHGGERAGAGAPLLEGGGKPDSTPEKSSHPQAGDGSNVEGDLRREVGGEVVVESVSLAQAEAIAGQNSGDSSLSDPSLVTQQATAPKVVKDAATGEIKGLYGPGESALDVPAKAADRQADEAKASTGGSSSGSNPSADELSGQGLDVSRLLSSAMDVCYDPSGGPAKMVGANYILERGEDRSITLKAKDGRGVIFSSTNDGVMVNNLTGEDHERLKGIGEIVSRHQAGQARIQPPVITPATIKDRGIDRGIELD